MDLTLTCKHCATDTELSLPALEAGATCAGCDRSLAASLGARLVAHIGSLSGAMAEARADFRFEVLLETDDLPEPHGFDDAYVLPEDRSDEDTP